ncbi:hypothetical protein FOL47_002675, partial [Perkinsus chesapeaki]
VVRSTCPTVADPRIYTIHAGLECGTLMSRLTSVKECASIGPTVKEEAYEDGSDAYFGARWAYLSVEEGGADPVVADDILDLNEETGKMTLDLPGLEPDAHLHFPFIKHHWEIVNKSTGTLLVVSPGGEVVTFTQPGTNVRKLGNEYKKRPTITTP